MTKSPLILFAFLPAVFALLLSACGESPENPEGGKKVSALKINGSTTVNLPVAEAAEVMRERTGKEIQVDTQGGSSGGISMLGEGLVHLGMASKSLSDEDRKKFPECDFNEIQIGADAVALIVSKDVWSGGKTTITKKEMAGIYEGNITNWNQIGGPDQRIAFFNKEPGRGTWEVFAKWAYGSAGDTPQASFPEVGGNEETRNKVASTRGALSQLSASWADGKTVFALSVKTEDGKLIKPSGENIATGAYPMSRPLFVLSDGDPSGDAREMINFLLSIEGQKIVRKHGYLALADLSK